MIEYTGEQKDSAVKELLLHEKTDKEIAANIGVDRVILYNLKNQQLGKEAVAKLKPRTELPMIKKVLKWRKSS